MLKIFSTQLSGIFKTINEDEFAFEDSARLLAQAAVGDGHIYIAGFSELQGLIAQVSEGIDSLPACLPFNDIDEVTSADRVLIATRNHTDKDANALAHTLYERNIPFVAMSSITDEEEGLNQLADVHIDMHVKRGLVPSETGGRIGFPHLLTALYILHGIQFTLLELLEEYKDE
ncbi:DUF2529 family protein [Bacillus sp. 1P06AnD]|uniref:DUF2529 family protein n=1 Tax=Bacillus sp. 1P06AnD TaxID=3132208 RepID=UPI0039A098FE